MKTTKRLLVLAGATAVTALAACGGVYNTDTYQAERDALYSDKPAAITCYGYGAVMFDGQSTGKVLYDEGGRVSFVDAATGRYTTVEGECRVVYARTAAPASTSRVGG